MFYELFQQIKVLKGGESSSDSMKLLVLDVHPLFCYRDHQNKRFSATSSAFNSEPYSGVVT